MGSHLNEAFLSIHSAALSVGEETVRPHCGDAGNAADGKLSEPVVFPLMIFWFRKSGGRRGAAL